MRFAISYAAQQVSGIWSWERDEEHIEKAFDFSGMGARNGVAAATMIQAGFTGVATRSTASRTCSARTRRRREPEEIVADLGSGSTSRRRRSRRSPSAIRSNRRSMRS